MKRILIFATFLIFSLATIVQAGVNPSYNIYLDKATIAKGYTVSAFSDSLKLSLVPGILSEDTAVEVLELQEELPMPWSLERVSPVMQFEFKNKAAYDDHSPFYIQFAYDDDSSDLKQVYFYDKNYAAWRPLPTRDFPQEKFVRSLIHLPYARIAVFSNAEAMGSGQSSWYAWQGGNYAASPDFPKGSRLRVYNLDREDKPYVDITINDYGPERDLFPERAIDLDKVAFSKIASPGEGIINVAIEPLEIVADSYGRQLGTDALIGERPQSRASSSIILKESDLSVVWAESASSTRPLASLTKLVALKVFLETEPDLEKVVSYKKQDEEYNYLYCEPWESSRVKLEEGDEASIGDLVQASLTGSANNLIETLVRVSGLTRDEFIAQMNKRAQDWGAVNTHFIEPTGLSPENMSSALEYAIITKELLSDPILMSAARNYSYKLSVNDGAKAFTLYNKNELLFLNKYHINGTKTGYLDEAGYCLITRVSTGADNLIVVVMGASSREDSLIYTQDLIKYGLKNY